MYCSSCGTALTPGLSYCNRCGANLSVAKDRGATEPPEPSVNSLLEGIVLTTLFSLGIILGGVVAMKALDVREALITAYMILSSLAFVGIYGVYIWQFFRPNRNVKEVSGTTQVEKFDTKELDAAQANALPEPRPSVTEHTTRTFEPVYSERKSE
jgi:hypothetical protein